MIDICNLRLEEVGDWVRLVVDISSDFEREDKQDNIWVAVKKENASMLTDDVYNAFLFLPTYMAMYYKSDLHIHGSVSKELYRNVVDYLQPILELFSDSLSRINIYVDGFAESKGPHNLVGTGMSCGVDCLQTVHKYYKLENDIDYKINSLFFFNCGWHGAFGYDKTLDICARRYEINKKAADELGLPLHMVDSNLHAFLSFLDDAVSYFYLYTCIFSLEKCLNKYYLSSALSYSEISKYSTRARNLDFAEFGDSSVVPLLRSKRMRIMIDGCQYTRCEKIEIISDWNITKKYLNVCCKNDEVRNCSECSKCLRTLLALEAIDCLEDYSNIFDIEKYKKISKTVKYTIVREKKRIAFFEDIFQLYKKGGKVYRHI